MAKRFYLSPIVGDGTEENPFRAQVQDHGVNHVAAIPSDPTTGRPLASWCLVKVGAQDHTALVTDPALGPLPDLTLDASLSTLTTRSYNALQTVLDRFNVRRSTTRQSPFRDLIRQVGRNLDSNFHEENFDIRDA